MVIYEIKTIILKNIWGLVSLGGTGRDDISMQFALF